MRRRAAVSICIAACLSLLSAVRAAPLADPNPAPAGASGPAVLSDADVALYRQILTDMRAGRISEADRLAGSLSDRTLMGYVEAEHLLSPASGRIPAASLVSWLKQYGDLPISERVRDLALQRSTKTVRRHHRRVSVQTVRVPAPSRVGHRGGGYEDEPDIPAPLASAAAKRALRQIKAAVGHDNPERAAEVLQKLHGAAPANDIAQLSQTVCTSYLIEGKNEAAFAFGAAAAESGREAAPMLDWCAGLSAFQLSRFADAVHHFDTLRHNADLSDPVRAAAAFWTARAEMRAGHPGPVVGLLRQAAGYEPTFYGLIAETMLGEDTPTRFSDPAPAAAELSAALSDPAARRAVALWQIDDTTYDSYVDTELNRAFSESDNGSLDVAYAYLARTLGITNLELRASETAAANGVKLTGLFPVPPYQPNGGYTVDPGLVLAFARIETRFQTGAVSPAGAVGLMQLMPATARIIGGSKASSAALRDPGYNMTLGERYIARILDVFDGNLIKLAAAYNAGPGKVARWQAARGVAANDPLVFLETLRAPETRNYVKKVLTYYWMYHRRAGDAAPSLSQVANGEWPTYHPPVQSAPPPAPIVKDEDEDVDVRAVPIS